MEKVLVVTGGSRGIGAATARLAAEAGYAVVIGYGASREVAERLVEDIGRTGGKALAVEGDVADEATAARLFDAAERAFGPVTALFNNAGITGRMSRLEDLSRAELERVFAVNVLGTFQAAREAVRRMSTRRGGKGGAIVNMSSRAGKLGGAGEWLHYAASKGAVDTFTVGLAREVGGEGIRVNAVAPGLIDTEIHAAAGGSDRLPRLVGQVPLGRIGTPGEVAETVLWLLGDGSAYVNGVVLEVSGGR